MSKARRIIRITIYILMVTMLVLLNMQYKNLPKGAESLDLFVNGGPAADSIELYAGEEAKLSYRIRPESFADRRISWEIGDESVATIDEEGKLQALSDGETILTAEAAGFRKNIKISVADAVASIGGFETDVTMDVGYSYEIEPEVEMASKDLNPPKLIFESDNEEIVTVDENGRITAVGPGTAHVTVKAGKQSKRIITRVREPDIAPAEPEPIDDTDNEQG